MRSTSATAEIHLIARAGATVVYCPTSNLYLASGAAPVRKMLDRGIAVALGTDGSASNTSQDLLECAKIGALLAKHAAGDAQALVAADVIRMMTTDGARLWGGGAEGQGSGGQRGGERGGGGADAWRVGARRAGRPYARQPG